MIVKTIMEFINIGWLYSRDINLLQEMFFCLKYNFIINKLCLIFLQQQY